MFNLPSLRLCLTIFFSLFLLAPQIIAGPLEVLPAQTGAPKKLQKRGILQDLYAKVPETNKVKTGAVLSKALSTTGDETLYAPTPFYGCTIVVVANGKGVMIGHFAEDGPYGVECVAMNDKASADKMVKKIEDAEALVDLDNVEGTQAWIVYSNDVAKSSPGYKAIYENLNSEDRLAIPPGNIKPLPYPRGSGTGETSGDFDKLVVQWQPKDDGSGATLNVYIRSDTPAFTGNYDCNGNPAAAGLRRLMARAGPACAPAPRTISVIPLPVPTEAPTCSYHAPSPPIVNEAYCSCSAGGIEGKYDLTSIAGDPVPVTASCAYKELPTKTKDGLDGPAPETDIANCQVCTLYSENGANCEKIPDCVPAPKS